MKDNNKFIFAYLPSIKNYSWLLLIENAQDLERYMRFRYTYIKRGFNKWRTKRYRGHACSSDERIVDVITMETNDEKLKSNQPFVNALRRQHRAVIENSYTRFYADHGKLLIWPNMMAICPDLNYRVHKTVYSTLYRVPWFTENDIVVTKWEGGEHWYARVASLDVRAGKVMKWSTREEALRHAREFLREVQPPKVVENAEDIRR